MRVSCRLLSVSLVVSLLVPNAPNRAHASARVGEGGPSPAAQHEFLDRAVSEFRGFKTAEGWLSALGNHVALDRNDRDFFQGEVLRMKGRALPEVSRAGDSIRVSGTSASTSFRFVDVASKKIEINHTVLSLEGLTAARAAARIEEALPRTRARSFSLVPEAQANPVLMADLAMVVAFLVPMAWHNWTEWQVRKGQRACDEAVESPYFRDLPKDEEGKRAAQELLRKVSAFKAHIKTRPGVVNEARAKLGECISRLEERLAVLQSSPVAPSAESPASSSAR